MPKLRSMLPWALAATLAVGCVPAGTMPPAEAPAPVAAAMVVDLGQGPAGVVVRPRVQDGGLRRVMATVDNHTTASIDHLVVKIYTLSNGGSTETYVTAFNLTRANLGRDVTFRGLRQHTDYRVRAFAYKTATEAEKISIDANSYTDINVTNDDAPTVADLPVKLTDVPFSGRATSNGLDVDDGGHYTVGAEFMFLGAPLTDECYIGTFAGDGSYGFTNGPKLSAQFANPVGIVAVGNALYVCDTDNNVIRKVENGLVSTFVGAADGTAGHVDDTGTAARLDTPIGICADQAGNLYFLEIGGLTSPEQQFVRKVTPAGVVTTIAGGDRGPSVASCSGAAATFADPGDIAVDTAGHLFVLDTHNQVVRQIDLNDANFTTTQVAGINGTIGHADNADGDLATFHYPSGLTVDLEGNVIIADSGNSLIRKIDMADPNHAVTTVLGDWNNPGQVDGGVGVASFRGPGDVAVDAQGAILVLDGSDGNSYPTEANSLRRITFGVGGAPNVTKLGGNGFTRNDGEGWGGDTLGGFGRFQRCAFDLGGRLYVIDDQVIREVSVEVGGGA